MVGLHVLAALGHDLWLGYLRDFVYVQKVRWIKCARASAHWTSLVAFRVDGARGHSMEAPLGFADRTPMVRCHLFSFPLGWPSVMQLQRANVYRHFVPLPHIGAILVSMVQVQISSPMVDVMRHLKQDSARAEIVVQFIQLLTDSLHIGYASLGMVAVRAKGPQQLPPMGEHGEDGAVPP